MNSKKKNLHCTRRPLNCKDWRCPTVFQQPGVSNFGPWIDKNVRTMERELPAPGCGWEWVTDVAIAAACNPIVIWNQVIAKIIA